MILTFVNVIYVLVAVAMIVLILLQRGAGAAAGSGFGGGASATVFGARGSANFLTSATKWLAVVFFGMSLAMAWNASRGIHPAPAAEDLGVMGELPVPKADGAPAETAAPAAAAPAAEAKPADAAAPAAVEAPADAIESEEKPALAPSEASKKD